MTDTPAIPVQTAAVLTRLLREAADDGARHAHVADLYVALTDEADDSYRAVLDTPAAEFTVTGWRFAAELADGAGAHDLALVYRRRALERAGLSAELDPGSLGYLLTIHPRLVDQAGDTITVRCTIPQTRTGELCTWSTARAGEGAWQAHDAYMRHVVHDHSTTATRAGDPSAQPGDQF